MLTSLDLLYLILSICAIAITVVAVAVGWQILHILHDLEDISRNVAELTVLVERLAQVVFPGFERIAKGAEALEKKATAFVNRHRSRS